jgi:hypothetical protein
MSASELNKYQSKEVLNLVLVNGESIRVQALGAPSLQAILNGILNESEEALQIAIAGGTPTVDGIDMNEVAQPDTPSAGVVTVYIDEADGHLKSIDENDNIIDYTDPANNDSVLVENGGAGTLNVIDDVNASTIYAEIFAKTFDKNVALRYGDNFNVANSWISMGQSAPPLIQGNEYVVRFAPKGTEAFEFNGTYGQLGLSVYDNTYDDGDVRYFFGTAKADDAYGIIRCKVGTTATRADFAVFDLTSMGSVTALQQLAIEAIGISWDFSTYPDWEDFKFAVTATADRNTIMSVLIPSHVSSMEPTIVSSLVNRGGNLAYLPDTPKGTDSGVTYSKENDTVYVDNIGTAGLLKGAFLRYQLAPNTQYSIGRLFEVLQGADADLGKILVWDDVDGARGASAILTLAYTSASGQFTTNEYGTIQVELLATDNTSEEGKVKFYNIQLNQGATANTYSAPLDNPFTVGSRSANQLRNGNGEEDVLGWDLLDSGVGFSHDGTDFILNNDDASQAKVRHLLPVPIDGTLIVNVTDITDTDMVFRIWAEAQMDTDPSGYTWNANTSISGATGFYEKDVDITATGEVAVFVVGIVAIQLENVDSTLNDTTKFKEVMVVKGEYTLVELQALGYVSYEPVTLLSCPNNAQTSTVRDRIYGQGDKIWLEHNVQTVSGFKYGDPEIDTTDMVVNGDFAVSTGWNLSTWTISGGVLNCSAAASWTYARRGDWDLVEGKKYRLQFTVSNFVASGNVGLLKHDATTILMDEITVTGNGVVVHDFVCKADPGASGTLFGGYAESLDCDIDDLSCVAFNIQENLAPTPEDITAFCDGSLGQSASVGVTNHFVSDDGSFMVKFSHYENLKGLMADVSKLKQESAMKTDLTPRYFLEHISTVGLVGSSSTVVEFSDIAGFPDYIEGAQDLTPSDFAGKYDTNVDSVDVFPNAIVINADATGTGALDVSCKLFIGTVEPMVTYVGA